MHLILVAVLGGLTAARGHQLDRVFGTHWTATDAGVSRWVYLVRDAGRPVLRVGRERRSFRLAVDVSQDRDRVVLTQPRYGGRAECVRAGDRLRVTGFVVVPGLFPKLVDLTGEYTPPVPLRRDKRSAPVHTGPIIPAGDIKPVLEDMDRRMALVEGRASRESPRAPSAGVSAAEIREHEVRPGTSLIGKSVLAVGVVVSALISLIALVGRLLFRKPAPPRPNTTRNPFEDDHV
jgi:hypothetical protein